MIRVDAGFILLSFLNYQKSGGFLVYSEKIKEAFKLNPVIKKWAKKINRVRINSNSKQKIYKNEAETGNDQGGH